MNTAPGWYPDPSDDRIMRFWDGTQWNAERSLSGTATVDDVPPAASGSTVVKTKISVPRLTRTGWFLFAGCAVAAVGTMLPWEQDTTPLGGQLTAGPSSVPGGVAMLLALLGLIVWIGWPARDGQLSKARCVGLTIVGALLMFFVFAKFAALGNAQSQSANLDTSGASDLFGVPQTNLGLTYHAGSGLYIYGAGVVAICVGVVRAWFARRAAALTTGAAV
ncbi:MAG TPA: DUF2510 domain-containing protein [Acidimicrobiia bacterium]|nr:DUF2510 domain-containing protein [Acidimicrobiia bacterium]